MLVTLCQLAYENNSNYFPFFVVLYMYLAGAKIDTITLLNHFDLSIPYKILQNKLYKIIFMEKKWIKQQGNNQ